MAAAYFNNDTIIAIATAPQAVAAVGIIRISGSEALRALLLLVTPIKKQNLSAENIKSHRLYRVLLKNNEGEKIDDAMFVFMRGPNSFTGEDVVEVHLHGNPYILQRCVSAFIQLGFVRAARAGEFSFRAFQNGKLDLSQAEAVMDLISSKSALGAAFALNSLLGNTKSFIDEAKKELLHYLAEVEVDIDFADQGVSVINYENWSKNLEKWVQKIEQARERFLKTAPLREGIRVSIVGLPNSGKSTLFNLLLGESRSIVSNIAGTTRDVVREQITLGGLLLLLSDTAGLRNTSDAIEAEGIARSYGEVGGAQLILLVIDAKELLLGGATFLRKQTQDIHSRNERARTLIILNKQDLLSEKERIECLNSAHELKLSGLGMSAKTGDGLKLLEDKILQEFSPENSEEEGFQIGRTRHYELLGRATKHVRGAIENVKKGELLPDLLSGDLRAALSDLGEITGEVSADDVLNYIFAEFCIGK